MRDRATRRGVGLGLVLIVGVIVVDLWRGERIVPLTTLAMAPMLVAAVGGIRPASVIGVTVAAVVTGLFLGINDGLWPTSELWTRLAVIAGAGAAATVLGEKREQRQARLVEALAARRQADQIQRALLPASLPTDGRFEIAARYQPAEGFIGGDWYDAFIKDGDVLFVACGDVTGHGVDAAITMLELRHVMRALALTGDRRPSDILNEVNRMCCESDTFATVLLGALDLVTGQLTWSRAGHPLPVWHHDSTASLLDGAGGPPLGAVGDHRYVDRVQAIEAGHHVLLYTDGLIERRTEALTAGEQRVRQALDGQLHDLTVGVALDQIVQRCLANYNTTDDVCALLVRSTG